MQKIADIIKNKSNSLISNGTVNRVIAWKSGEFFYDNMPAVFDSESGFDGLVYDEFCGGNLSKYAIEETRKEGKLLIVLKPCDTYSFNQLLLENRIKRDEVYVLGVPCTGMLGIEKIRNSGINGMLEARIEDNTVIIKTLYGEEYCNKSDILLEKCIFCKGNEHVAYDEIIDIDVDFSILGVGDRFSEVSELEKMAPEERFEFWRNELSKCVRCNACRNTCPACSCIKCVFDNADSGVDSKANPDDFEENMFHIIRAFHVAGRCTDCGECTRVCPQGIKLHLLNRKLIKDINIFYGDYQAGAEPDSIPPLASFEQKDVEPSIISEKGRDV